MRRAITVLATALVVVGLAACGASSDQAQRMALAALNLKPPQLPPAPPTPPEKPCGDVTASLRPPAPMPAPGAMPRGSFMAQIEQRGHLLAGVNQAALGFGYANPFAHGQIQGFEIDLLKQLARAIFGDANPNRVRLVALTVPQRIPFVQQGKVDIVVDVMTITCARRQEVDFSTVYYNAGQRVLVPKTSSARGLQDLAGKRVCATAGSAPFDLIASYPLQPIAVGAPQAVDCLVYLQQGTIDAISTDDAIMLGFKAQDPYTKIVGGQLAAAPYGMAISKAHPDFVRFVNGVLAQLRTNGSWQAIYKRWLGKFGPVPAPPKPSYSG